MHAKATQVGDLLLIVLAARSFTQRRWNTKYPVQNIQVFGSKHLPLLCIAMHYDGSRYTENHHINSLQLFGPWQVSSISHTCKKALNRTSEAIKRYLNTSAFLFYGQGQTSRELSDNKVGFLRYKPIISRKWDKNNKEILFSGTYCPHCYHWNVTPLENSKEEACPHPDKREGKNS